MSPNNQMEVVKYLKKGHTLEDLNKHYGIQSRIYPDRVVLNYNQIDSDKHKFHKIVRECRSLILSLPDYNVLSRSFDRFFNLGEDPSIKSFNISRATCLEKIDGSLMNLYHDGKQWNVSSRSMAFAEGETCFGDGTTFAQLFLQAAGWHSFDDVPDWIAKESTHIFELVSPKARVVKPYPETEIYYLASRVKANGYYVTYPFVVMKYVDYDMKCTVPSTYKFDNLEDCIKASKELPTFDEGYVCWDHLTDERVKIKNPAYLAIAHMRNNGVMSVKRVIKLILSNDHTEYLAYFPEDKPIFDQYEAAINKFTAEANELFNIFGDMQPQKKYALAVKDHKLASVLFAMRKGVTAKGFLENSQDDSLVNYIRMFLQTS